LAEPVEANFTPEYCADLDPHLVTGHGKMANPPEGKPSGSNMQGR